MKSAKPVEQKASATAPLIALHAHGRAAWSGRDLSSLTRNGFTQNPVCFRAIKLVAEAAAAVPLKIFVDGREVDIHIIASILNRPNPSQSPGDFFEALYGQLLLSGNGYLERAAIDEIYVLRSDRMRVIPGRDGWVKAYEYAVGAKKIEFLAEEGLSSILHLKSFHPSNDHYGLSPMQAAARAIDVHSAASSWSKSLLDNAARPSGAIVYRGPDGQGTLPSEQYDRLVNEIESNHAGAMNAGRPMLLEGGLDWKPMGFSPSDMEFQKTKDTAAREIALAFGVPPMLLGLPGDNTYANYAEANRAFYRLTVLPLVQKTLASLGLWLGQSNNEAVEIRADLDAIAALSSERDAQWRRIADADFLSEDEKRKLLGLGPKASQND